MRPKHFTLSIELRGDSNDIMDSLNSLASTLDKNDVDTWPHVTFEQMPAYNMISIMPADHPNSYDIENLQRDGFSETDTNWWAHSSGSWGIEVPFKMNGQWRLYLLNPDKPDARILVHIGTMSSVILKKRHLNRKSGN